MTSLKLSRYCIKSSQLFESAVTILYLSGMFVLPSHQRPRSTLPVLTLGPSLNSSLVTEASSFPSMLMSDSRIRRMVFLPPAIAASKQFRGVSMCKLVSNTRICFLIYFTAILSTADVSDGSTSSVCAILHSPRSRIRKVIWICCEGNSIDGRPYKVSSLNKEYTSTPTRCLAD